MSEQTARHPEATSILSDGPPLSYRELARWVASIARDLSERGAGRGERVALVLGPGREMVAGILGVLMAGAAYVPVLPDDGAKRVQAILADSAPLVILTTPRWLNDVPEGKYQIISLMGSPGLVDSIGFDGPGPAVSPDDPAYR